ARAPLDIQVRQQPASQQEGSDQRRHQAPSHYAPVFCQWLIPSNSPGLMVIAEITGHAMAWAPRAVNDPPALGKDRERPYVPASGSESAERAVHGPFSEQSGRLRPQAAGSAALPGYFLNLHQP